MPGLSRIFNALRRRGLKRVAVLPFVGSDDGHRRLASGLATAVRDLLSRSSKLAVIGEISSRRAAAGAPDAPLEVARTLGVDAVLTGRLTRSEADLEVSCELHQVEGGSLIWSGSWSVERSGIFGTESQIARGAGAALGIEPAPGEELLHREPTTDMAAYERFLQGREALERAVDGIDPPATLELAAESFESALRRDALFAAAWAGLSECHRLALANRMPLRGSDGPTAIRDAARRALEIDESLPEARVALGVAELFEWKLSEAKRQFARALESAPSHPAAHRWLARVCALRGDFAGAVRSIESAVVLEPGSNTILNESAWIHALAGRPEEAKERSRQVVHRDPEHVMAYFHLGQFATHLGKPGEAVTYFRAAAELSDQLPFLTAFLGMALVEVGDRQEAEDIARDLARKARRGSPVATSLGALLIRLGEIEDGLRWLETALESKEELLLTVDTHWLPLPEIRSHPRFTAIKNRLPDPCVAGRRP